MMNILIRCNCSPKNALIDLQCRRSEFEPIFNASQQGNCTRSGVSVNPGKGAHLVHKCNWGYLRLEILISLIFRGFSAYVSFCRLCPLLDLRRRSKFLSSIQNQGNEYGGGGFFSRLLVGSVGTNRRAYFYGGVADRGRITPGLSELL